MQIISRAEAKLQGLNRYFTGEPCGKHHVDQRRTCSAVCLSCEKKHHTDTYNGGKRETKINNAKLWAFENKLRSKEIKDNWVRQNPLKHRESMDKRNVKRNDKRKKQRVNGDAVFIARESMSGMVKRTLKLTGKKKKLKTCELLGYTSKQLRDHLESLFTDGMSWNNHGEWHIDHIMPVSILLEYGITDPAFINGLDNLQPLWAIDNMRKGNRYVG